MDDDDDLGRGGDHGRRRAYDVRAVIVTGAAIGTRVVLRAGKQAVAFGELVDVDGEVGVRILEVSRAR